MNGPTDKKIISTQAQVIRHVRGTLQTIKKEAEQSLDWAKKNGYKENRTLVAIVKMTEDEDKYLLRMDIKLNAIGELQPGQKRIGEMVE